ncbi:MAG: dTMP kinase, partial [Chloroflexota bacterium]|nr:dTMP kinase [Chloroflexota bacterium]
MNAGSVARWWSSPWDLVRQLAHQILRIFRSKEPGDAATATLRIADTQEVRRVSLTAAEPIVPDDHPLPGRLFIVEGIDGSGKSTQLDLLRKWLLSEGYLVVFTEWNSSPIVKRTTSRGKNLHLLSPMTFSLIHAADLANRFYSQVMPALEAGAIVLADRYIYTAFARDAVRGVSRPWLRRLYAFAAQPTLAFYFDVPLEEAAHRILSGRPEIKYYEAGMDMGFSSDPYESFRTFQAMIREEYERLVDEFSLVRMDATAPLTQQQQRMRELVRPHLDGVMRQNGSLNRALAEAGLQGRYLAPGTDHDEW